MKHFQRLSLLLFALLLVIPSTAAPLSEEAKISLLTCSPGQDLYAVFGHSAFRVNDPINGIDKTYNYGTFEFNTPNFYLKFIRGKLLYKLGIGKQDRFIRSYIVEERSVIEEVLDLSEEQKQQVYAFLEENLKPENRYYQYDFFFDNCATRVRDVLQNVLKDSLQFVAPSGIEGETYRDLIQPYIQHSPWVDFGIDLALGLPTDEEGGASGRMFLPDHLSTGFQGGKLFDGSGQSRPLIKNTRVLYKALPQEELTSNWLSPKVLFWGIAMAFLLLTLLVKNKKITNSLDLILYLVVGITGLILFFLMFGTEHQATARNLNILWANPLCLLLIGGLWKTSPSQFYKSLLYFLLALNLLVLAMFWWFPQALHFAVIPILLILILRMVARRLDWTKDIS